MQKNRRVLILTLWGEGGVGALTRKMIDLLHGRGFEVALAYYMPYRQAPELSVPIWQVFSRKPSRRTTVKFGVPAHEIGVWLPEFEWARGLPSAQWREVLNDYDIHVASCGSILAALPALLTHRNCLAWVATPYFEDRKDRRSLFPWLRWLFDTFLDMPVCLILEKWALARAEILALSHYTENALQSICPSASLTRMPMSVDTHEFYPVPDKRRSNLVGYAGRYDDPRKNVKLLIDSLDICRNEGLAVTLELVGGGDAPDLVAYANKKGLAEYITFRGLLSREGLVDFYRTLELSVISSFQEGLAIVGLEAMACGCPVISTRCGGPEEYIIDGKNGLLVTFDASQMAAAITSIVKHPEKRTSLSRAAISTMAEDYDEIVITNKFWSAFDRIYENTEEVRTNMTVSKIEPSTPEI